MHFFKGQLFAAIHDKDKTRKVFHFSAINTAKFNTLNKQGYGLYFTANSFKNSRKKENLVRMNAIVGDLDVAKDEDQLDSEELIERKETLMNALNKYCPPSWVVITKNGIQPWYFIDEDRLDNSTIQLYEGVTCGLIDLSKEYGALGDEVKDVARLWRIPGFWHQKSDPFLITEVPGNKHLWALTDLKDFFWREPVEHKKQMRYFRQSNNPLYCEIDKIDIRQIVIRAGKQLGRKIEFGKDDHLILDDERRGTFIGTGGQFIATQSSVFPIKGNRITVVANMLGISNKEAIIWICEQFDNDPRKKRYEK
ncbi:MAG: hypothetical protein ABH826_01870 [Patescibacteria group bacterium]